MSNKLKATLTGVAIVVMAQTTAATADVLVFDCRFKGGFEFYVTIYDDGSPARIGVEQGIGSRAQPYFDKTTNAWILVEFMAGGQLPSTLTTILEDGTVWHSRHTLSIDGAILPSQQEGKCGRKAIN